ncbi:MAG: V-type ATP synthase subunit E [Clostridia bacterium]|nr:V-type ATP synthase subunit E [Clostridia bacterium]
MTGLEKILDNIIAGARSEADGIIAEAQAQADELLRTADIAASDEVSGILAQARERAVLQEHISRSGSALRGRNLLLSARREIIDEMIGEAKDKLCAMPDKEYFAIISRIAARYASRGEGEIVLSSRDKARLPKDFIESLDAVLPEGAKLSLADDAIDDLGGFILRYGGVEENCTFAALIEQDREQLADKLSALLF